MNGFHGAFLPALAIGLEPSPPFTRRVFDFDPLGGEEWVFQSASNLRQFERLLSLADFSPKPSIVLLRFPVEVRRDVLFPKAQVLF